jgi:lysophospholipase L1-like esterase
MKSTKLLLAVGLGVLMIAGVGYRMPQDPTVQGSQTVAAVGDSITAGYLAPVSWPTEIGAWDTATITNLGHPGWTTATMAEHFNDALATGAQVITIMGGTNDCGYGVPLTQTAANIASMVTAAQQAGRQPVLIGPLPRDGDNPCLLTLRAMEASYAAASGITFVDPWDAFSEPDAFQTLYVDGTHPNAQGAFLLASVVADQLGWVG